MPRELVKLVCQAVVSVRDGDRIVDEITSAPVACYGEDQLVALWKKAAAEVDELNAAELALAGTVNRQARRRKAPAKGGKKT